MFIMQMNFTAADILYGWTGTNNRSLQFPRRATKRHPHDGRAEQQHRSLEEQHMTKLAFIAGALAILSAPALAGSAASGKPMVVAEEGGVSVSVGDRDHDRDRDHHRKIVVLKHHDEDHHRVVVRHHDHDDHGDHDHDQH
jgi:hypothetical protein